MNARRLDEFGSSYMRIVTCSNSAARVRPVNGVPDIVPAGPGGVVPMVAALMRRYGGDWLFSASESGGQLRESITVDGVTTTLHPCPIDPLIADRHHGQISIQVLQQVFHYLVEPSGRALFEQHTWAAWAAYRTANEEMARRVSELCSEDTQNLGFVNDHQFLLVPEYLRRMAPARPNPLVYFHQLPWCEPDYFAVLPAPVRDGILRSLLNCDVVGFHARRWADAFRRCCDYFLPDVEVDGHLINTPDRAVRVAVAPGPIDELALARIRADGPTDRWRAEFARRAGGRRLLVRAERFDLWKNIRRGLVAYEALLRRRPGMADEIWFCALLSMPTRATDRHDADRRECEILAARINDRFGVAGRDPVQMLFARPGENTQHRVVAALEMAAATLVNATYDGLNLVAMESMLLAPTAPVILSVNAGAHETLAEHTIGIDPFDIAATTDAIAQALSRDASSSRTPAAGGTAGRPGNPTGSAEAWLRALLDEPVAAPTV
jgi:trehalose 6-phosphate synthase